MKSVLRKILLVVVVIVLLAATIPGHPLLPIRREPRLDRRRLRRWQRRADLGADTGHGRAPVRDGKLACQRRRSLAGARSARLSSAARSGTGATRKGASVGRSEFRSARSGRSGITPRRFAA